jgi:arsenate reductase
MTTVPEVLFVCVHNAGRSQMAAGLLHHHGAGAVRVRSAGSAPADEVITMGCGDACPVFPGKRYLDWELEDPAGQGIDAVRPIRDEIDRRVRELLAELLGTTTAP